MTRFLSLFIVLIGLLSQSCQSPKEPVITDYTNNTVEKEIIINGKILNFNPDTDDVFIKLGNNDIFDIQRTEEIVIDDSGNFSFVFHNIYPGEYYLVYHSFMSFYAFPGDSLYITIDKKFTEDHETYTSLYNCVSFTGSFHQMTLDFHRYNQYFRDYLLDIEKEVKAVKDDEALDYKKYIEDRIRKYQTSVQKYMDTVEVSAFFKEWSRYHILYRAYDDLMRYRWLHASRNHIKQDDYVMPDRDEYMTFLNDSIISHKKAIITWYYASFVRECSRFYSSEILCSDSLSQLMKFYKKRDRVSAAKMRSRSISRHCSGYGKDLAVAQEYSWLLGIKDIGAYEQLIPDVPIKDSVILQLLNKEYQEQIKHIKKPVFGAGIKLQSVNNKWVGHLLDSIANKYQGKVLYIDFWAPWCSPCMGGIEQTQKLKHIYAKEDIVFIYFGVNCDKDKWKATISKKKIKGEHFYLDNNQYSSLKKTLGIKINGIPHYIIVDKKGIVVNKNAPRPFQETELSKIFTDLLNK